MVLVTVACRWYPEVSVSTAVEESIDTMFTGVPSFVGISSASACGAGAYNNINAMVRAMARIIDTARTPRETLRGAEWFTVAPVC